MDRKKNREILFRALSKESEKRVYGSLIYFHPGDKAFIITGIGQDFSCVEVLPETISQFIGKCDSEGNKIFEGDVVRISCDLDGEFCQDVISIFWCERLAAFVTSKGEDCEFFDFCHTEVIENIYED